MAVPCKRTEPILTVFSNGFEFRKLNRKISGNITAKGNMEVSFIRVLSKEEAEELKDMSVYPISYVFKSKLLIHRISMSPDTIKDLAGILGYMAEHIDEMKYTPEEEC